MIGTALPLAVAAVYAIMFILVVRLFRSATKKRRPMVLSELNRDPTAVISKQAEIDQILKNVTILVRDYILLTLCSTISDQFSSAQAKLDRQWNGRSEVNKT